MIPLRDVIPSRTTPWVTMGLIGVNAGVFIYELLLPGDATEAFFMRFGLVPAAFSVLTLFTSMFLHAGWLHAGSNLLALWIFGDNVEDRMGHGRFLAFYLLAGAAAGLFETMADAGSVVPYLLAGAAAGLFETMADAGSVVPLVGASGAIAGVMGAYLFMFPTSQIHVLIFLFFYIDIVEIPAAIFLTLWFLLQILGGVGRTAQDAASGGVAFWAHVGGFLVGAIASFFFRRPERVRTEWWNQ
jgi:membrane associated rhomboid family serine protease